MIFGFIYAIIVNDGRMRWPPLFPSADKTRIKTAPAANKQKVTASADRKSEPMKSARIERADGTERSYLFFRGAEADGCRIREAAVKHRTDYFKKERKQFSVEKKNI